MVSMKDIARECQVSIATVSKALNGYGDIGEATRKKVREAADRLGYFPNSSARALKTKRTNNLGVLFEEEANSGLTHDFFNHVLQGFKVTAEQSGYDITFTSELISTKKMTYLEHCMYRGLDGVVIACVNFYEPAVQELIRSDVPVVTIDHVFDNRIAVVSDNVKGMKDLTEYVIGCGHTRIAMLHGLDSSVTRARVSSFYRTMEEHRIKVNPQYVRECAYRDHATAQQLTHELMALPVPPTCILYSDDYSCLGGYKYLQDHGYEIGKDISVAGYDGIALAQMLSPSLCTIHQDADQMGAVAAKSLISLIENPMATIIEKISVSGNLQEGASVAQLNT